MRFIEQMHYMHPCSKAIGIAVQWTQSGEIVSRGVYMLRVLYMLYVRQVVYMYTAALICDCIFIADLVWKLIGRSVLSFSSICEA